MANSTLDRWRITHLIIRLVGSTNRFRACYLLTWRLFHKRLVHVVVLLNVHLVRIIYICLSLFNLIIEILFSFVFFDLIRLLKCLRAIFLIGFIFYLKFFLFFALTTHCLICCNRLEFTGTETTFLQTCPSHRVTDYSPLILFCIFNKILYFTIKIVFPFSNYHLCSIFYLI